MKIVSQFNKLGLRGKDPIAAHNKFVLRGLLLAGASLFLAVAAQAKLTVTWTDNAWDETGYAIERAEGAGAFSEIVVVAANQVSYDDNTVVSGSKYSYRVRASNSAGYSAYSNVVTNAIAISTQPVASVNAVALTTVELSVVATGVPAPVYQWQRNGVNLTNDAIVSGATSATLTFTGVMPVYSDTYAVVVSNGVGSPITSTASVLSVPKIVPVLTWTNAASIDNDVPLSMTQLNASTDVAGTFSYSPDLGTTLPVGTQSLGVTFTPSDTANYTSASKTVSIVIVDLVPSRPALFDATGYLTQNGDVAAGIGNAPDKLDQAWTHYYKFGVFEGRSDGEFNVQAYLAQYPGSGPNVQTAAMYWYTTGRPNGQRIPAGFDVDGYFARNLDIKAYFTNDRYGAWLHYYNYGLFEGRSFDTNFIAGEYLELNLDLKEAGGGDLQGAVLHWLSYGHPVEDRMGRVPIGFNVENYLARYPDLAAAFANVTPLAVRNVAVWHHYIAYGTLEGRSDGDFEAYDYLATNPDLAVLFAGDVQTAALHWFFYGRREGRRIPFGFDVQNYRTLYPDLVVFSGDDLYGCWLHFRDTGINEGRIYDNKFRPADYLALNPDIFAVIGNNYRDAFLHWIYYGQFEGRLGKL